VRKGEGSVTERTESAEKTPVDDECIPFLVTMSIVHAGLILHLAVKRYCDLMCIPGSW